MSYAAGLAADACQFAVGVIEKIRQDQQHRAQVRPAVGSRNKRYRGSNAESQTYGRQVVRGDRAVFERRDQTARQTRIPWTRNRGNRKGKRLGLGHDGSI